MLAVQPAQTFSPGGQYFGLGADPADVKKPLSAPSAGVILGITAAILVGLGGVYYMYKNPVEYDRYGRRVRV